jgi:hypothetical protein
MFKEMYMCPALFILWTATMIVIGFMFGCIG